MRAAGQFRRLSARAPRATTLQRDATLQCAVGDGCALAPIRAIECAKRGISGDGGQYRGHSVGAVHSGAARGSLARRGLVQHGHWQRRIQDPAGKNQNQVRTSLYIEFHARLYGSYF